MTEWSTADVVRLEVHERREASYSIRCVFRGRDSNGAACTTQDFEAEMRSFGRADGGVDGVPSHAP